MPPNVELVRHQWEDGYRRFRQLDRAEAGASALHDQVGVLLEQLRRRVGSNFTLAELAGSYDSAERWAYDTLEDRAERPGWAAGATIALDAAFHLFSRGAQDYTP
jgi:hypothetical protein